MRRWVAPAAALALSSALGILGINCSGDEAQGTSGSSPCETVLKGQCGATCTYDTDCGGGLYCTLDRICGADCAPGAASCPSGQTCGPRGRCAGQGGGGNGGGGTTFAGGGGNDTGTGGGSGGGCADVNVTFTKQTPTVMLLLDQSGSMTERFGNSPSRWQALYDTLMAPATGVVKSLEGDVRFGLALYTSHDGTRGGATCPLLTQVPIALNNFSAIDAVYSPEEPDGDTPTGDSITAVTATLAAFTEPGPKVIVLATDGEPDTCAVPNPQTGQPQAIAAAQASFSQGIKTFIIGVGDEVGAAHLQDMANAGAGLPVGGATDADFYSALNEQALIDAFSTIIDGVRSCTITLDGTVAEADAGSGRVTLDGQTLVINDPNGWTFHAPDGIELLGTSCAAIQSGDHTLSVTFPCDTVVPR